LLLVAGAYGSAAEAFGSAVGLDAGSVEARRGLALALAARGDRTRAAAEFRAVLKRRPTDGVSLYNLVALSRAAGDEREEERAWRNLLAARPDDLYGARGFIACLGRSGEGALESAAIEFGRRAATVSDLRLGALLLAAAGRFDE